MSKPSKPMAKNSNNKFIPRNNKQDIFSKLSKTAKFKTDISKQANTSDKPKEEDTII